MKRLISVVMLCVAVCLGFYFASVRAFETINSNEVSVVDAIKKSRVLVCQSYYDYYTQISKKKNVIFSDDELVIVYKVTLKYGFNLFKMTEEDLVVSDTAIVMNLPKPEVIRSTCNPSDKQVFHSSGEWSNWELQSLHASAIASSNANAKKEGVIEKTEQRGKDYFFRLFKSFGYKPEHIHINIKET